MPKIARELSALEVKRLAHPGPAGTRPVSLPVGGIAGLMLQVTSGGGKSWLLRVSVAGKRREIGLGSYPEVTLAAARDRARETKDKIRNGIDPVEERKAARASLAAAQRRGLTFEDAVDRYCQSKLDEFRSEKHRKQWRTGMDRYTAEPIGKLLVSDITVADILRVLEPIWLDKTETARKLRGRIEKVLSWATVAGHREGDNPARWTGHLSEMLPAPGKVTKKANHPAVALDDVAAWFAALRKKSGTAARALEFLTLCGSRSGEIRGATWEEVDLSNNIWTIPAERMKMEREHRIPLSAAAVQLLESLPRMKDNPLVFPAPRGGQMSDMTISAVMRRMQIEAEAAAAKAGLPPEKAGWRDPRNGRPAVPHGLRSTFRDWTAERTEFPRDMAEIALAHSVGSDVERAYRRGDMLERRRIMMQAWSEFIQGKAAAVVVRLHG